MFEAVQRPSIDRPAQIVGPDWRGALGRCSPQAQSGLFCEQGQVERLHQRRQRVAHVRATRRHAGHRTQPLARQYSPAQFGRQIGNCDRTLVRLHLEG